MRYLTLSEVHCMLFIFDMINCWNISIVLLKSSYGVTISCFFLTEVLMQKTFPNIHEMFQIKMSKLLNVWNNLINFLIHTCSWDKGIINCDFLLPFIFYFKLNEMASRKLLMCLKSEHLIILLSSASHYSILCQYPCRSNYLIINSLP